MQYHFYVEFGNDVKISIKFRKDAVRWYANNESLITSGFYNLTITNKIIIKISKTFIIDSYKIRNNYVVNSLEEIFDKIEFFFNSENDIVDDKNIYKSYSKKQLITALKQSKIENEIILKNQNNEIENIFNKLGRISWDENYNYEETDFDSSNSVYSDIYNAIVLIQDDIKEILRKRDKLIITAQESEKLKTAFLANMSHEIRTPLNSIIGFSDILGELIKDEKQKSFIKIINDSGIHLLSLINNIIDASKMQSGTFSLHITNFDLNLIINEVISGLSIVKPDINIEKEIINSEMIIIADETRLKQIFINLLNNAIKFTDKGSISIGYKINNDELQLFVKDSGVGIPENELSNIFERFKQVDNKSTRLNVGSGLGLTITKKLVELHGGKIWVKSKENVGSTFYFTLPNAIKKGFN